MAVKYIYSVQTFVQKYRAPQPRRPLTQLCWQSSASLCLQDYWYKDLYANAQGLISQLDGQWRNHDTSPQNRVHNTNWPIGEPSQIQSDWRLAIRGLFQVKVSCNRWRGLLGHRYPHSAVVPPASPRTSHRLWQLPQAKNVSGMDLKTERAQEA